jgi:hypothetical protein
LFGIQPAAPPSNGSGRKRNDGWFPIDVQIQRCAEAVAEILHDRDARDDRSLELASVLTEAKKLVSEKTGHKKKGFWGALSPAF